MTDKHTPSVAAERDRYRAALFSIAKFSVNGENGYVMMEEDAYDTAAVAVHIARKALNMNGGTK